MKLKAAFVLLLLSTGCLARRVREEAAITLDCRQRVDVELNEAHGAWLAEGCGRFVVCHAPGANGAEVQCAGGAPGLVAHSSGDE